MTDISLQPNRYTFYLNGLTCANCAGKIENVLKKDVQLEAVHFSFATKKLIFYSDFEHDYAKNYIQTTVDSIEDGVIVSDREDGSKKDNCKNASCMSDTQKLSKAHSALTLIRKYYREITGSLLLFILLFVKPTGIVEPLAYFISYLLIGGDIAFRAIKNLLKGKLFDENFLMTLATVGAFALSEFTEAVAVMLFYKIGEAFQDSAVDNSRKNIKSLLDIKADYANRIEGNKLIVVDPVDLQIGDKILIKAGEKIPVDCTVIEGSSTMNTSALTGESLPLPIELNSELLSGSINISAPIKARVIKTFENSTVSKILDMVENATGNKAKTEQFITKFARIYTPIVVFLALALAFIPPIIGIGFFSEWISRALIFLVISCPCALVLSVPLGFFGGLGAASRKGILIKGGNYLEGLNTINSFVFDKTGTLTKGNFAVSHTTDSDTLRLAAYIEVHSTHPIGKSILEAFNQPVSVDLVQETKELSGEGLIGKYQGKTLAVGNMRLMNRLQVSCDEADFSGTTIYVAYDSAFIGHIFIADEIKSGSIGLAKRLKESGTNEIIMLTGDQKKIADSVAKTLEIDQVQSQLLPQDKLSYVENLIQSGKKVLFVGDGINDAPVLARADIGVAMGGIGSDAAIEAADIILMTDEPNKLLEAKQIAKRTRNIVLQNIFFALGIKLFFLILGAFGYATMYEAIFADVGVALIAVLNSMRTIKN